MGQDVPMRRLRAQTELLRVGPVVLSWATRRRKWTHDASKEGMSVTANVVTGRAGATEDPIIAPAAHPQHVPVAF